MKRKVKWTQWKTTLPFQCIDLFVDIKEQGWNVFSTWSHLQKSSQCQWHHRWGKEEERSCSDRTLMAEAQELLKRAGQPRWQRDLAGEGDDVVGVSCRGGHRVSIYPPRCQDRSISDGGGEDSYRHKDSLEAYLCSSTQSMILSLPLLHKNWCSCRLRPHFCLGLNFSKALYTFLAALQCNSLSTHHP